MGAKTACSCCGPERVSSSQLNMTLNLVPLIATLLIAVQASGRTTHAVTAERLPFEMGAQSAKNRSNSCFGQVSVCAGSQRARTVGQRTEQSESRTLLWAGHTTPRAAVRCAP